MTDEIIPPLQWTPQGERRNQLQGLAALFLLAKRGHPPTQEVLDQTRLQYLKNYRELGGSSQEAIDLLSKRWTLQSLREDFLVLNGKI